MKDSYMMELKTLMSISSSVLELYNELAILETQGKKESIEFKRILERLNCSINLEKSLLVDMCSDYEKIKIIREYLYKSINMDNTEALVYYNQEELIKIRLFWQLGRILLTNSKDFIMSSLPQELKELIEENEELESSFKNSSSMFSKYETELETESQLLELILIEKSITNPYNKGVKADLIKSKYIKIFSDTFIEQELLESKMVIPSSVFFISTDMYSSVTGIPEYILKVMKNKKRKSMYYNSVDSLLKSGGGSLPLERILRRAQIQVALQYYSDTEIDNLNEEFHTLIESDPYRFNEENIEAIASAYRSRRQNKELVMKVSFKG